MKPDLYRQVYEAENSHWWHVGNRELLEAVAAKALRDTSSSLILDSGCGTGDNIVRLSRHGKVFGVDLSPDALKFCVRRNLSDLALGSVVCLPFANEAFHLVLSSEVIYHSWVTDDVAVLQEIWRVLKPGGTLILQVAALEIFSRAADVLCYTRHRYTRSEVREKMGLAGFRINRISYRNTLWSPLALVSKALSFITGDTDNELHLPAPWLNNFLLGLLRMENRLLNHVDLPFGVSVFGIAIKPDDPARLEHGPPRLFRNQQVEQGIH